MKWCVAMVLGLGLGLPAAAQECFVGQPRQVTYDDGRVVTIIQRHGDDLTYTIPQAGNQDTVHKSHLMLFPKASRSGARSIEHRWSSNLPKLGDLVPGYRFDLAAKMKSGDGAAVDYRSTGEVLGLDEVKLGDCRYAVLVIRMEISLDGQLAIVATQYFSADLGVVLASRVEGIATGSEKANTVTGLQ